jgi:hypothetical protein
VPIMIPMGTMHNTKNVVYKTREERKGEPTSVYSKEND